MISENIVRLIELQEVLNEVRRLNARLEAIPVEVSVIEQTISTAERERQELLDRIDEHKKSMKDAEREIETVREKQGKFKEQLMGVKTNVEYRALLNEIDAAKSTIGRHEDSLIEKMEVLEGLNAELAKREDFFNNEKIRIEGEKNELSKEIKVLESQVADLNAKAALIEKGIPKQHLSVFKRVFAAREGVAISRAVNESCTVCMMHIRPQLFQEVKKAEEMLLCENCKRILYWLEDDPTEKDASDETVASV